MTVVFVGPSVLVVDNISVVNGFGQISDKMYTVEKDGLAFNVTCCGYPACSEVAVNSWLTGTPLPEELEDTYTFVRNTETGEVFRLAGEDNGSVVVASPLVEQNMSVWGDGQKAFAQACQLHLHDIIRSEQLFNAYKRLHLGDTSRAEFSLPTSDGLAFTGFIGNVAVEDIAGLNGWQGVMEILEGLHWNYSKCLDSLKSAAL
jgi:hypothetical protein